MNRNAQTQSIWTATADAPALPQFESDLKVDVAIVGAGITGMTAAALLKRAGKSVAVLERGEFGRHGTTHRTTAHLTVALDQSYPTLIRKFNQETARTAVHASSAAINQIESLARDLNIDCEFRRVDGYRYTESPHQVKEIESDLEAAHKLGVHAEFTNQIPLPFKIVRGYRLPNQAQFHPLKYIFGLAKHVNGDGCRVFHKSAVRELEGDGPCKLKCDHGTVMASHVILATHTPMGLWPTIQTRLVPYHSYCLAIRIAGDAPLGLFWDTADPYHYIRRFSSSEKGNVLIIGGADSKTGFNGDTRGNFRRLERYAQKRFDIEAVEQHWSAEFFEPADGLPYIGRAPGKKHVFIATGYSGTGMTYGTAAAMLITDLITGRSNHWEEAFKPSRVKPIASARRVLEEAGTSIKGLITDRIFKASEKDLSSIACGEGKVMSLDGERIAVHRDESGELHGVSPACTHMGCLIQWNSAEKHWDCKCHGSLFTAEGEPIAGPATTPLEPRHVSEEEAHDVTKKRTDSSAGVSRRS